MPDRPPTLICGGASKNRQLGSAVVARSLLMPLPIAL